MAYSSRLVLEIDSRTGERSLKRLDGQLQGVEQRGKSTASAMDLLRKSMGPLAAAVGSVFTVRALKSQIDFANNLADINVRLGASVQALSQYSYVAKQTGVQFNQLTTAWQRQTRRIAEAAQGTGAAKDALDRLNLSASELAKLAPEDQFERIAAAMAGVSDKSEQVALAMKVWDTEGVKLLNIVNQGADGIARLTDEADRLGVTITEKTAQEMAEFNAELNRLSAAAQGVSQTMLAEMVPAMTDGLESVSRFIDKAGGAEVIVDKLTGALKIGATLMAARYAGAMATSTTAMGLYSAATTVASGATATLTGRMTAQAGAATMAAGATRGAAAAMALVGGPAGVAVLAGTAIYYFREELELTEPEVKTTDEFVRELSAGIDTMSESALNNRLDVLRLDLAETSRQAISTAIALSKLEETEVMYGQGMAADRRAGIEQRNAQLEELQNNIDGITTTIEEAAARRDELISGRKKHTVETDNENAALKRQSDAFDGVKASLDPAIRKQQQYAKTIDTLAKELAAGNISQEEFNKYQSLAAERLNETAEAAGGASTSTRELTVAANESSAALDRQANAAKGVVDRLYPLQAAQRKYAQEKAALVALEQREGLGRQWLVDTMLLLNDEYVEGSLVASEFGDSAVDAADAASDSTDDMAKLFENSMSRMDDAAVDMWRSFLDGSETTFDSFKNIALDALAEVIHAFATRQITAAFGIDAQGGGAGGGIMDAITGGGQSGGGFSLGGLGNASGFGQVAGNAFRAFQGTGSTYAGTFGSELAVQTQGGLQAGFESFAGSNIGSNLMGGVATAGAGILGGMAGTALGGAVSDKKANSSFGASGGAAAGAYIGSVVPVIGTAIGAAIGGLVGGIADVLGGSKDTPLKLSPLRRESGAAGAGEWDQGLYREGAFGAVGWEDRGTKELKDKWDFEEAQQFLDGIVELDNALASLASNEEQLKAMGEAVRDTAAYGIEGHHGYGRTPGESLDQLTSRYQYAIQELDSAFEDIILGGSDGPQQMVEYAMQLVTLERQLDGLGEQMFADARAEIEKYAGTDRFDGAISSMSRAAEMAAVLGASSEALNLQFDITAQGAIHAASKFGAMTGGAENYLAIQDAYYQSAYSSTEKLSRVQSALAEQVAGVTDETITSVAQLRELVEAQNLHTTAGQEMALSLMAMAPALAETTAAVEDAIEAQYQSSLGREADADGLAYWMEEVASGAVSLEDALGFIADASEDTAESLKDVSSELRTRESLEQELLKVQGNTAALQQIQIDSLKEMDAALEAANATGDRTLVSIQEEIWATEKALAAQKEADRERERAERDRERAEQERIRTIERQAQALDDAKGVIAGFSRTFDDWIANLDGTDKGMGTPQEQLSASAADFQQQLALARSGDRDALSGITGYADRYLEAAKGMYASGGQAQSIKDSIKGALEGLPDLLSPEQFLADEFKKTIDEQTGSVGGSIADQTGGFQTSISGLSGSFSSSILTLSDELTSSFGDIDLNSDGLIDWNEFYGAFEGLATDDELLNIFDKLDANGDGTISKLEAIKGSTAGADKNTNRDKGLSGNAIPVSIETYKSGAMWQDIAWNFKELFHNEGVEGWAAGGYTGAGGVHEYAGSVHKGEIVWSQRDIARAGGVSAVESLRKSGAPMATPVMMGSAPLLGRNDMVEALQDLRNEVAQLRKENAELQRQGNQNTAQTRDAVVGTGRQAAMQRDDLISEQRASTRAQRLQQRGCTV